jgi:hypothetical protein
MITPANPFVKKFSEKSPKIVQKNAHASELISGLLRGKLGIG